MGRMKRLERRTWQYLHPSGTKVETVWAHDGRLELDGK